MNTLNTSTYNITNTLANNGSLNYTITGASVAPYSFINNTNNPVLTVPAGSNTMILEETAALEVKGKLILNGQNLEERLTTIEQVLGIPERDVELEKQYPKLKKMYEAYIKELSKYRMWKELKE